MSTQILTNARIITPDEDFTGALVIEDGIITDIRRGRHYPEGENMQGMWLAPGCIDIHTDYLEKEIHPRPSASFPLPLAFHFMDLRAAACGLTTVYSAISFSDNTEKERSMMEAVLRAKELDTLREKTLVHHYLHARIDPNCHGVVDYLNIMKTIPGLTLIVYNDSIPGQRQFRLEDVIPKRARSHGITEEEMRQRFEQQIAERSQINHRDKIQAAFGANALLGSHDDTTAEHVDEAFAYGATLSEMPTTMVAARRAKELGMWVCMGAPNYVRGGSHCGNLSCAEAMQENLVDIICSDYHFPSMLTSVLKMMHNGMTPAAAMRMVSLNPARFLRVDDRRGSIASGREADLVAFRDAGEFAQVQKVWIRGENKYQVYPQPVNQVKEMMAH
jgi:alpha-D-ribose 1-methylphosphonate 5-triphosphate diphosphatase